MVFKRSGDERLSLVLRRSYPFLSEEDLKSPFSDIPTFLTTDMEDENYCDYSKLEDLNTPTPLDSVEAHFDYEYLNLNELKAEETFTNELNNNEIPIRQTQSLDESHSFILLRNIKPEYTDEGNSDYHYYMESQEISRSETNYPASYTTDPSISCTHAYHTCTHDQSTPISLDQQHQRHLQTQQQQQHEQQAQYQPNYYQPCYIEPLATPFYPNTQYTNTSSSNPTVYLSSASNLSWDPSCPIYSPDSGICNTSPNTHPSPYAVSTSSYSNRSDIGDLDSDILRLTTTTTQPITTTPLNSTTNLPLSTNLTNRPNPPTPPSLARQISAPMDIKCLDAAKSTQPKPRVKIADSQKPFLCGMFNCTKRFVRVDELKRHQRTHSGVKQFVCEDCQKGFTRSDHLTTHRRTHTGERPYACSICDRRFARSDEKNRHEKTHSKEKSRAGRKPREIKKPDGSTVNLAHSL